MPRSTDGAGGESAAISRRAVLAGGAAAIAGSSGFVGRGAAQGTRTAVIPMPSRWSDENLAGFMIHLGASLNPTTPGNLPTECEYRDWPPEEVSVYDVSLINRKDADTPEIRTELSVNADADFVPGQLFLINTFEECTGGDFLGVQLEQIGRRIDGTATGPHVDVEDDSRPNTETGGAIEDGDGGVGGFGPGFDVVGTVLAVAGVGGWLAWRRNR